MDPSSARRSLYRSLQQRPPPVQPTAVSPTESEFTAWHRPGGGCFGGRRRPQTSLMVVGVVARGPLPHARHVTTPGDAALAAATNPQPAPGGSPEAGAGRLVGALMALRETLASVRYPLAGPNADEATHAAQAIVDQLDDYLLPRLGRLDAPLLVVVGGSTGAGKSTLVNSLVRAPVSPPGVLRPTTRAPLLLAHPADLPWFVRPDRLPGLPRASRTGSTQPVLQVVSAPLLQPG